MKPRLFFILLLSFLSVFTTTNIAWAERDGRAVEVQIVIVRGDMIVPLKINGETYQFVLDTGASNSVLLRHKGTKGFDNLKSDGSIELLMPLLDRTVEADLLAPIEAAVRTAKFQITNAARMQWHGTGLFSREENIFYDGILGSDLFEAYIVEIDQAASVIRLHDKAATIEGEYDLKIPLQNQSGVFTANLNIKLGGRLWPRRVLIDTGFPGSLNLYGLEDKDVRNLTDAYGSHRGSGRRVEMEIGGCKFENVRTVAFREPLKDLDSLDGIIGIDFLRQFRFALDYQKDTLHLFGVNKEKCMTGIAVK